MTKRIAEGDRLTQQSRFWAKVNKTETCWLWTGAVRNRAGHGAVTQDYRVRYAHRVAYEWLVGPIPPGLVLDHLCRNPPCVNPAHLEPVTPAENTRRGESLIPANALKTHCPKGHPYEGNTYVHKRKSGGVGRDCATCAKAREAAKRG